MRVQLFRFDRYPAGQTDFEAVAALLGSPLLELDDAFRAMAEGIAGTANNFSTITIVGHSDRQDRADFNCDQRRQSEIDAASARANSAWDFCRVAISQHIEQISGAPPADWWETSDRVTWDLVFASVGMLRNGSASEDERLQNRRVDILVSIFRS